MASRSLGTARSAHIDQLVDRIGADVLGNRMHRMRVGMGLSIRDVAASAKISKTSLVRLEQGHRCRAATIARVCEVLGVHVERLEDGPSDSVGAVHRAGDDRWVDMMDVTATALKRPARGSKGGAAPIAVAVDLLRSRLTNGRVLPTLLDIRAASSPRSHPGEEFVYVLSGKLRLTVGSSVFLLAKGESICFWSGEPHSYAPAGRTPARVLSVRVDG
ncbi:MAG: helix-turn-helix transcriptional regulator [Gemmatimonadaceae bacterium]|nr:helix-turn-helix transcriptional regulator [Gemmatimonadaceae bacterium]